MSLLNGLSTMGAAISQTAGTMAIAEQKRQAEIEATQLANQLAGKREAQGRYENAQYEGQRDTERFAHEDATLKTTQEGENARQDKQIAAQKDITGMQVGAEGGRLMSTYQDGSGNLHGITHTGKVVDLKGAAANKPNGLSTQDNQLLERLTTAYTKVDDSGNKIVDIQATHDALVRAKRDDLAQLYVAPQKKKEKTFGQRVFGGGDEESNSSQSPSQPSVPASLAGKPGLQWSPSQKKFRDSTGKMYDASGAPVN